MIDKLNLHYSFTNPASVYDEEALTALELAGRQGAKINEVVDDQNKLRQETNEHLNSQDTEIIRIREVIVPRDVNNAIIQYIADGKFDESIDIYAGELTARLNTLLGSTSQGSTTLDAEIIDARVGIKGRTFQNLGESIRGQVHQAMGYFDLFYANSRKISVNTTDKTVYLPGLYIIKSDIRHFIAETTVSYANCTSSHITLIVDPATNTPSFVNYNDAKVYTQYPVFTISLASINVSFYRFTPHIGSYIWNGELYDENHKIGFRTGQLMTTSNIPFEFNTTTNVMIVNEGVYFLHNNDQQYIAPKEYSYGEEITNDTTVYFVFDTTDNTFKFINQTVYKPTMVLVFTVQTNYLTNPFMQGIETGYRVDGTTYSKYLSDVVISNEGGGIVYVDGNTGSDTNSGSQAKPFRTLTAALKSGASVIYVEPMVYRENLNVNGRESVKIYPVWKEYTNNAKTKPKIVIDGGVDITPTADATTGLMKHPYNGTSAYMRAVFINKTIAPVVDNGRSGAHTVCLWNITDSLSNHYRLTPVLTLAECQASEKSWFYDGEYIYINDTASTYHLNDGALTGCSIQNVAEVVLEDVEFIHCRSDCLSMLNVNNATLKNCVFSYSSTSNGVASNNTNAEYHNCVADWNCNDGFNFHQYGQSTVIDCQGRYNFDDGISHHYGHVGTIYGGLWLKNGKGGISSPTYDASVNVYNACLNANAFGVLAFTDSERDPDTNIIINNCGFLQNGVGIRCKNYNLYAVNCLFVGNTTDTEKIDNGVINKF